MHRDPISTGFAGTVPVLWVLNIVAARKRVGDAKCPGFQEIIKILSPTRKETCSEACQIRARFKKYGDASCHQIFFPASQGA